MAPPLPEDDSYPLCYPDTSPRVPPTGDLWFLTDM